MVNKLYFIHCTRLSESYLISFYKVNNIINYFTIISKNQTSLFCFFNIFKKNLNHIVKSKLIFIHLYWKIWTTNKEVIF